MNKISDEAKRAILPQFATESGLYQSGIHVPGCNHADPFNSEKNAEEVEFYRRPTDECAGTEPKG